MKIHNAFRLGLIGTLGVGAGLLVLTSVITLQTIIVYIGAALFIALGLDPAVSWLERKGFPRWAAIATVLAAVLGVLAAVILAVAPIVIEQVSKLAAQFPELVRSINASTFLDDVQNQFPALQVSEVVKAITDNLGANLDTITTTLIQSGLALLGALFGGLIILILTLFFTASL
ncbi:MAG: AI-2E family transporter, partial [Cryobacterium sp.]